MTEDGASRPQVMPSAPDFVRTYFSTLHVCDALRAGVSVPAYVRRRKSAVRLSTKNAKDGKYSINLRRATGPSPQWPNDEAQAPRWVRSNTETFPKTPRVTEVACSAWFGCLSFMPWTCCF